MKEPKVPMLLDLTNHFFHLSSRLISLLASLANSHKDYSCEELCRPWHYCTRLTLLKEDVLGRKSLCGYAGILAVSLNDGLMSMLGSLVCTCTGCDDDGHFSALSSGHVSDNSPSNVL